MNFLYVLVAVVIIGGAAYFLTNDSAVDTPAEQNVTTSEEATLPVNDGSEPAPEAPVVEPGGDAQAEIGTDVEMEFPIPDDEADLEARVFDLEGFNFGYDVSEIRVKEGETVTINFSVREGFHDWVLDEFDAATERIREGGLTSVTFVADKAGTYEYYCSVGSHRAQGMVGTLIVE